MRSFWKGPFIDFNLFFKKKLYLKDKKNNLTAFKNTSFFSRSRRSTILPFLENKCLKVYNGNKYIPLNVKSYHIGHKLGNFVPTKKKCIFRKKTK